MTVEEIGQWVERFQVILAALPVVVGLAAKAWHDIRRTWREFEKEREAGYLEAAQYLWARGQQIKPLLKEAGHGGDFPNILRDLAPAALRKYGLAKGYTDEEVQRVLDLARGFHKKRKAELLPAASAVLAIEPDVMPDPPEGADAG